MLTNDVGFVLYEETHYAGGSGTTARAMQKLTDLTPNLIELPLPKAGSSIKMPLNLLQREQVGGTGVSGIGRFRIVKEIEQKKGELECYIQNKKFFDWVLTTLGASTPSKSFTVHWQTTDYRFEAYGCSGEELVLNIPEKELPSCKLSFNAYAHKYDSGSGTTIDVLTGVGVDDTQPLVRSGCSLQIDSTDIIFGELNLNIKNGVELIQNGIGFEQIIKSRELTGDFSVPLENFAYNSALLSNTITKREVKITLGTIAVITITDCELVVEEIEDASKMESDLLKRSVKFYPTNTSTITVA